MDRRLLIATIYAPSGENAKWYALQRRFIAETTSVDYRYGVFLNGVGPGEFEAGDILGAWEPKLEHSKALDEILGYFRTHAYESYLILDSDCFPIRAGWHDILTGQMRRFEKRIAAPVRVENLDLFPHPCAMFLLRSALAEARFALQDRDSCTTRNLLGQIITDVGSAMQDSGDVLPLLRTNIVNVHPVAAAVYHHLFYHHGAGSRKFGFRVLNKYGYYEHWYDSSAMAPRRQELLDALFENPDRFIGRLLGEQEPMVQGHLISNAQTSAK